MLIQFTHDFRGKLTQERFFPAGTVIDLDEDDARVLIREGHAVEFEGELEIMAEDEAPAVAIVHLDESAAGFEDEDTGELDPGIYDGWTKPDLYAAAVERDLDVTTRDTKAELLAALLEADAEADDDGAA